MLATADVTTGVLPTEIDGKGMVDGRAGEGGSLGGVRRGSGLWGGGEGWGVGTDIGFGGEGWGSGVGERGGGVIMENQDTVLWRNTLEPEKHGKNNEEHVK